MNHLLWRTVFVAAAVCVFLCQEARAQIVRGYTGTQIFQTCGIGDPTEEMICGVIAGNAVWLTFVAEETGVLYLNTDGSSFDTILAVFGRSPNNPNQLEQRACDNNSGQDHIDSALQVAVQTGETNLVVIAGVGGACGLAQLNYSLVTPSVLAVLPRNAAGQFQGSITGHAGMRYVIQGSTDLKNWSPLLTNTCATATCTFTDPTVPPATYQFYKALMLP